MKAKYSNGAYITTSKAQDNKAMELFRILKECANLESMGTGLNQKSGNCDYYYKLPGQQCDYVVTITRKGSIVETSWK